MSEIREEDIRPDLLMREHARLHAKDIKRLLAQRSGFVNINCPACESDNNQAAFDKDGFAFVACKECGTVFINPRPTLKMLKEFYTSSKSIKYWGSKIFPATEGSRRERIFSPRAKNVAELTREYDSETKTLLDVGAGFGTFCEEIKKLDIFEDVIAVEPSHELAET